MWSASNTYNLLKPIIIYYYILMYLKILIIVYKIKTIQYTFLLKPFITNIIKYIQYIYNIVYLNILYIKYYRSISTNLIYVYKHKISYLFNTFFINVNFILHSGHLWLTKKWIYPISYFIAPASLIIIIVAFTLILTLVLLFWCLLLTNVSLNFINLINLFVAFLFNNVNFQFLLYFPQHYENYFENSPNDAILWLSFTNTWFFSVFQQISYIVWHILIFINQNISLWLHIFALSANAFNGPVLLATGYTEFSTSWDLHGVALYSWYEIFFYLLNSTLFFFVDPASKILDFFFLILPAFFNDAYADVQRWFLYSINFSHFMLVTVEFVPYSVVVTFIASFTLLLDYLTMILRDFFSLFFAAFLACYSFGFFVLVFHFTVLQYLLLHLQLFLLYSFFIPVLGHISSFQEPPLAASLIIEFSAFFFRMIYLNLPIFETLQVGSSFWLHNISLWLTLFGVAWKFCWALYFNLINFTCLLLSNLLGIATFFLFYLPYQALSPLVVALFSTFFVSWVLESISTLFHLFFVLVDFTSLLNSFNSPVFSLITKVVRVVILFSSQENFTYYGSIWLFACLIFTWVFRRFRLALSATAKPVAEVFFKKPHLIWLLSDSLLIFKSNVAVSRLRTFFFNEPELHLSDQIQRATTTPPLCFAYKNPAPHESLILEFFLTFTFFSIKNILVLALNNFLPYTANLADSCWFNLVKFCRSLIMQVTASFFCFTRHSTIQNPELSALFLKTEYASATTLAAFPVLIFTTTFDSNYWFSEKLLLQFQSNENVAASLRLNSWFYAMGWGQSDFLTPLMPSDGWRATFNSRILDEHEFLNLPLRFTNPNYSTSTTVNNYFENFDPNSWHDLDQSPLHGWLYKTTDPTFFALRLTKQSAFSAFWLSAYLDSYLHNFYFFNEAYFRSYWVETISWSSFYFNSDLHATRLKAFLVGLAYCASLPLQICAFIVREVSLFHIGIETLTPWPSLFPHISLIKLLGDVDLATDVALHAPLIFPFRSLYAKYKYNYDLDSRVWASSTLSRWRMHYLDHFDWNSAEFSDDSDQPLAKHLQLPNVYTVFDSILDLPLLDLPTQNRWALFSIESPSRVQNLQFTYAYPPITLDSFARRDSVYDPYDDDDVESFFFFRNYQNFNRSYLGLYGREKPSFYEKPVFRFIYLQEHVRLSQASRRLNLFVSNLNKTPQELIFQSQNGRWSSDFLLDGTFFSKFFFNYWASKQAFSLKFMYEKKFQFFKILRNWNNYSRNFEFAPTTFVLDQALLERHSSYTMDQLNNTLAFFFHTFRNNFFLFDVEEILFTRSSPVLDSYKLWLSGDSYSPTLFFYLFLFWRDDIFFNYITTGCDLFWTYYIYLTSYIFWVVNYSYPIQLPISSTYMALKADASSFAGLPSDCAQVFLFTERASAFYYTIATDNELLLQYIDALPLEIFFLTDPESLIFEALFFEERALLRHTPFNLNFLR